MKSVSPVIHGLEPYEIGIGEGTFKVLRSPDGRFFMRWSLTPEEREQIAGGGADIYVTIWTGNQGMCPMSVQVLRPDIDPQIIVTALDLDDEMMLRMLNEDVNVANEALAERISRLNKAQAAIIKKIQDRNQQKPEGVKADAGDTGNNDQGVDA